MARITLTEARVTALKARKTAYDTRDGKLKGFGVRVLPSGGKRFFIHCQHRGERIWRIVGATDAMGLAEARTRAVAMLTAIRRGEEPLPSEENAIFENVADEVFDRYALRWKPGTLRVNRCYLRNQILPRFAGRQIMDIDSQDVRNWFASLRATPVAADRSMPVLSVIMGEAEAMGLRPEGSNPCRGIRRYENGATIVTSNLPFQEWTSVFASERLTDALLDRITHHVHILEMNADSYRLKQSRSRRRPPSE